MATRIELKHPNTGLTKDGYVGFSWTTAFFGFFPALFRGDFITFLGGFTISLIIGLMTLGIGSLFVGTCWAFMYNKYYTRKLLERGYVLNGSSESNLEAAKKLGIAIPT